MRRQRTEGFMPRRTALERNMLCPKPREEASKGFNLRRNLQMRRIRSRNLNKKPRIQGSLKTGQETVGEIELDHRESRNSLDQGNGELNRRRLLNVSRVIDWKEKQLERDAEKKQKEDALEEQKLFQPEGRLKRPLIHQDEILPTYKGGFFPFDRYRDESAKKQRHHN